MRYALAVLVGRLAGRILALRGGGTAVPGRIAELLAPNLLRHCLSDIPVVFVTGSNGKTSTARLLVAVLRAHGCRVHSNSSGANMSYGIVGSLLKRMSWFGRLKSRLDYVILEVDEGYVDSLSRSLQPRMLLVTNLQIDQLNRYRDPGLVLAKMLSAAAAVRQVDAQPEKPQGIVLINYDDAQLHSLILQPDNSTAGNSVAGGGGFAAVDSLTSKISRVGLLPSASEAPSLEELPEPDVLITSSDSDSVELLQTDVSTGSTHALRVSQQPLGLHQAYNVAAALAAAQRLLGSRFNRQLSCTALEQATPAFGRGELLDVDGLPLLVLLMKNPRSFQANLDALAQSPARIMIGIDEGTPDPSWLYSIDPRRLTHVDVVTGSKAWQIATWLAYREIPVGLVEPHSETALKHFLGLSAGSLETAESPRVLLLNYEQSLHMLRLLKQVRLQDHR